MLSHTGHRTHGSRTAATASQLVEADPADTIVTTTSNKASPQQYEDKMHLATPTAISTQMARYRT